MVNDVKGGKEDSQLLVDKESKGGDCAGEQAQKEDARARLIYVGPEGPTP
jgi:hypothetical protein